MKRLFIFLLSLMLIISFATNDKIFANSTISANAEVSALVKNNEAIAASGQPDIASDAAIIMEASTGQVDIASDAAIIMEASTGQVIYEKSADVAMRPASITKIMTLNIIFDAIDSGKIGLEDEVVVSEHAASMGGSQVFLEQGEVQTVNTLIKCISMASANDACVAMAEYISGTEALFVEQMNNKAASLNMNNTHFVNCCGLDADGHVSSARDVAIMSQELIVKHPQIHDYSCVWMDTIIHKTKRGETEFTLTNTNKLMKQYSYATGLKTGSTSLAGCCLSATANKDGIELIAVVMNAPNSKTRFADAITLLNYGYSICNIYVDDADDLREELSTEKVKISGNNNANIICKNNSICENNSICNNNEDSICNYKVKISCGKSDYVSANFEKTFSYMFLGDYNKELISKELVLPDELTAPIQAGDVVGTLNYYYDGTAIGSINLIAIENVAKATYKDALLKGIRRYLNI